MEHAQTQGRHSVRVLALLGSCALLACLVAVGRSAAAQPPRRLLLYSVAEQEQFINHQDDRIRGAGKNPFGNFSDVLPATKVGSGPYPGDDALFSFNLYTDPSLRTSAGSAVFSCQYNFDANAFCTAYFHLADGGTLVANGAFNFRANAFTLEVIGGSGAYIGAGGVLDERAGAHHTQRLSFALS
jgi:hypothetical protein